MADRRVVAVVGDPAVPDGVPLPERAEERVPRDARLARDAARPRRGRDQERRPRPGSRRTPSAGSGTWRASPRAAGSGLPTGTDGGSTAVSVTPAIPASARTGAPRRRRRRVDEADQEVDDVVVARVDDGDGLDERVERRRDDRPTTAIASATPASRRTGTRAASSRRGATARRRSGFPSTRRYTGPESVGSGDVAAWTPAGFARNGMRPRSDAAHGGAAGKSQNVSAPAYDRTSSVAANR